MSRDSQAGAADGGLALAVPGAIATAMLFLLPTMIVIILSFTNWQFGAARADWIGMENYRALAGDAVFRRAVGNSLVYALLVVPGTVFASLFLAIQIHASRSGERLYRLIHYIPYMATFAAMAVVWEALLHPTIGLVNHMLSALGIGGSNWLRDPDTVLPILAVIAIWQNSGYAMVIFLAGLKAISPELYEAAALDGADGFFGRLWTVTLPQLAPTTLFVVVVISQRAFSSFSNIAILTQGGPNHSSDTIIYRLFDESFGSFRAGYGAAIACTFLVLAALLTLAQMRLGDRKPA